MAAMTNFLENKLVDFLFRGEALNITGATAAANTGPANHYIGLMTAVADGEAGTVTEVATGSYARVTRASSLANWAGTQEAASTVASTGTGGATSNNASLAFPTPTAGWGTVTHFGIWDASAAGNLLYYAALSESKTINTSDTVSFAAGALTVTFA